MEKLRYGILGVGTQGKMYADFLMEGRVENALLGGLYARNPDHKSKCEELYPGIPFFTDYNEMLESGEVDAVITCVPHYLHPEMGLEALRKGVHILLEKPVGIYSKQVRELNEYALKNPNLAYGVMFNQRMHPLYQRIKEIVEGGEIGEIRRTNWIITSWWRPQKYYDQSLWRGTWWGEGGGVLVNQAPHQLDLLQWICGMPKKVYSKVKFGFKREIAVEDEVTALLEYENGATGVFITCTHDVMGTDRFEIQGDLGKIIVEDSKRAIIKRLKTPELEMSKNASMDDVMKMFTGGNMEDVYDEEVLDFTAKWGDQHCRIMENFADHILRGTPLLAKGIEGINEVILSNSIHLSTWLDKEVELPIDEDLFLSELNKRIEEEKSSC